LFAVEQRITRTVVAPEIERIHHRHHRVEPCQFGKTAALFVSEGERLGDRQRLAHTGGFNQQIIKAPFAREASDFLEQVLAQRAADAAVAHLDEFFLGAVQLRAAALDERRVNVDLAHVVHDERDAHLLAVMQNVIEQCRLARAEEAGQDGNGNLFRLRGG